MPSINMPGRYMTPTGSIDTGRLKSDISIVAIAGNATDLHRSGTEWRGLCPLHDERTPSFFVSEERQAWFCFGCGAGGDAIELDSRLHNRDFLEACAALADEPNVSGGSHASTTQRRDQRRINVTRARQEWRDAISITGTPAESYLLSRHVHHDVPGSVRFSNVPRFWRDDGSEGPRLPAMIAAAQDRNGRVVGIQRTFLDRHGRKARFGEPRLALGRMRGSALRLGPVRAEIMLACATEDALALRLMFPGASVWSAFGDANLPHVALPPEVRNVTLCGDADAPGRAAVLAATEAYGAQGREVADLPPRGGAKDFNEEWLLLHA